MKGHKKLSDASRATATAGVKGKTEIELLGALQRLVDGTHDAEKSDGDLTVVNLAAEAGVTRVTVYRSERVTDAFKATAGAIAEGTVIPKNPRLRVHQLEAELARAKASHAEKVRELRDTIETLANQIQILALRNEALESQAVTGAATVIPLKGRKTP